MADDPGSRPTATTRFLPAAAREQAAHFLATGELIDVCGGAPCVAIPTG
jgi:hypothetical protein